jgi:hypothetical protein
MSKKLFSFTWKALWSVECISFDLFLSSAYQSSRSYLICSAQKQAPDPYQSSRSYIICSAQKKAPDPLST